VAIVKEQLSQNDTELLEKILEFSGYTTTISVSEYINDCTDRAVRYKLKSLFDKGFLKQIFFYSDSRRDTIVYQVKAKTCKLFDNPDSYFRKRHNDVYIIRGLIKQHFLFETYKTFGDKIITNHDKRLDILKNQLGINEVFLPQKYNMNVPMTHIEEVFIDGREGIREAFICKSNNEAIEYGNTERLVFVYIDKFQTNPSAQLATLIKKYHKLISISPVRIDFLIVVDTELREHIYQRIIDKNYTVSSKNIFIPESIIQYHIKILEEHFNLDFDKTGKVYEAIKLKYFNSSELYKNENRAERKNIIRLSNNENEQHKDNVLQNNSINNSRNDGNNTPPYETNKANANNEFSNQNILKEVKINGIKFIEKQAKMILNSELSMKEKSEKIKQFFAQVYSNYSSGVINQDSNFSVKIYRINYKFSV